MKLWPFFSLLLLAQQPALHGQGAMNTPSENERKGDAALADGLWEVAELHFRECLADDALAPEAKSQVAIRLAETLIREGNAAEALELLAQSFVDKNPETPFWKAQALAGQRHFSEAVGIFSTLLAEPSSPHFTEAGMTQASLQLALGQPDAALETLSKLLSDSDAATKVKIRLYQVEILLDLDRTKEAREAMPDAASVALADRPLASFLEAQLRLGEGHPDEAEEGFQELLNHPQGQSLIRHHSAAIGLADAIRAQGNPEAAASSLLSFIQDQPDSPLLEPMFKRILQWLPEKPTSTDPILERLVLWVTPSALPTLNRIGWVRGDGAAAWPVNVPPSDQSELLAFSIYASAVGLHRIGTPEAKAESQRLLNRLRLEYPDHFLASRALYQSARWLLDAGSVDQAFSILNTLRETAKFPELKGEAAFLEAHTAYQNGDPKLAIQLFDEAAKNLAAPEARSARLQAAVARLRSGDPRTAILVQNQGTPQDKDLEADLELERALATTPPSAAKPAIEEFLNRFPDHPRAPEARLAAAEAAFAGPEPDLAFARAQLDALAASPEKAADLPAPRIALARLRIADLSKNSAATIAEAQAIIDTYPGDPAADEAALTLGRNLFQAGNYNSALLVLKKLAAADSNPVRSQVAWLLAARSAALGGTPQSKEDALELFDNAIASKGPLTSIATLEKAAHLIDLYRLAEASAFLAKWTKTLTENDPLQLPAGLLLGEALYAQGSGNPSSMVEALAVYDKLLAHAKSQPALLNRLQYLRGTTLEQLPDEKNPGKKREKEAFQAYYSVLETTTPPAEWEYFERCGFGALALLEKAERWQTAISVAQKIASFKGPQSETAAARAKKIKLEQMIFEDD
ncbi:MAG: tetratricopeptide repeat protein [Verrucomicrobiota bacterium]